MKTLLIFDSDINPNQLSQIKQPVDLFPLTSNFFIHKKMETLFKTTIIETAKLINEEVIRLQKKIHEWSYHLSNYKVRNKTLKEWFLMPDQSGSAWWFGLISEKNTVQDDVFFKIAQANAIDHYISQEKYTHCVICLNDSLQASILKKLLKPLLKKVMILKNKTIKSKKDYFFEFIKHPSIFGAFLSALLHGFIWIRDSVSARKKLSSFKDRFKRSHPFLFISYFPNIDENAAKNGKFRNKYGIALQEKLLELKKPLSWLLMPVYYNGHNYASSLQLAKGFMESGETIFLLQEFFTLKVMFKTMLWWFRQTMIALYLYFRLDMGDIIGKISNPRAVGYLKYLWWHSFMGTSGTRGLIFYLTYREMFKKIANIHTCLYYCEMQAWEKALLIAKNKISINTRALAFQHTIVTRNFFHYFYAPEEIEQHNVKTDFPIPDQLIANGKLTYSLLQESRYPRLFQAEAIRQLYIQKGKCKKLTENILFVGGSYDRKETLSLLSLLHSVSDKLTHFTIWLKGSPINPLEPLFKLLNINWKKVGYKIVYDDLKDLLPYARVALIANTTVALEALSFDCPLIIPFFSDTMLMNPVTDTPAHYSLVSNPSELIQALNESINKNQALNSDIIHNYWNINPDIPLWSEILSR